MRHPGRLHRRDLRVGGMDPIAPGPPHGLLTLFTGIWGVRLRAFVLGGLIAWMAYVVGRLL